MGTLKSNIKNLIITGIFFLVPIVIILVILGKVFAFCKKLQVMMHLKIAEKEYFHVFINDLVVVFIILFFCFLAGLIANLNFGKKLVNAIEENILVHIPGYDYSKATAQEVLGVSGHSFQQVVLYRDDDGKYQIAFKVEDVGDYMMMIFTPETPKPRSGEMLLVHKKLITETDLTMQQAFAIMKGMGKGGGKLFSKYFPKENENS